MTYHPRPGHDLVAGYHSKGDCDEYHPGQRG